MPINLRVKCHGMIAYVPSDDEKRMAALLCKGEPDLVPNQAVYLRFPVTNYRSEHLRQPTLAPAAATNAAGLGHITFEGERLSIKSDRVNPADATLKIDMFDDDRRRTPTNADRKSFIWMPDIQDLTAGNGDINSQHLKANPAGANPPVLGRVDFNRGRLGTTGVERVQVPFRSTLGKHSRSIAREALLELQIDGGSFIVHLEKFDGSSSTDLVFEADGDFEIVIGNEPEADIYKDTPPITMQDLQDRAAGEFNVYYDICAAPLPQAARPLPLLTARPGLTAACSGGRYPKSKFVVTS